MTVTLPWCPGVNNLFATYQGRRIPSRRYKAWKAEAGAILAALPRVRIQTPAKVSLVLTAPDRRARDADGYLKAPIDLLVSAGVLAGDSAEFVRAVSAEWSDASPSKPGSVLVKVEAYAPQGGGE